MSTSALFKVPTPINEPVRSYSVDDAFGRACRASLQAELERQSKLKVEIPMVIGGKHVRTNLVKHVRMPHSHREVVGEFSWATEKELSAAVQAALHAKEEWELLDWSERVAIFLKAADLIEGPYRDRLNAATMLGQGKSVHQAEIDAACELIDFLRFNAHFYEKILQDQPVNMPGVWNKVEARPLEGFVAAITPFNFTAIAANLCAAPAMLGNTVVWKPSDTQMLSAHYLMEIFKEAGVPDGVINLVPADGPIAGQTLLAQRELGGIHFTGSTQTFRSLWKSVGERIGEYRTYPRLVGETGGKDFIFAHASAQPEALVAALVRGAFEYQGQKCSAASRAYIPAPLWKRIKEPLLSEIRSISMGDVRDFSNFMNAVIDERSFKKIEGYLSEVKRSSDSQILVGGEANAEVGYFVSPTLVHTQNPNALTMREEIFGPVLTVYVYEEKDFEKTLSICDQTSPYALTGAIFAQDRYAVQRMNRALRNSAGNFYINDKCTGAVVGQQPFGGARASGTNDKAGSALNLHRWISSRTIKEVLNPPSNYRYSFLKK